MLIKPQPKQELFLSTPADIAIYGGGAGGGKTWALLVEAIRYIHTVQGFGATFFRRQSIQITAQGGLWDSAIKMYPQIHLTPFKSPELQFRSPIGNKITFRHIDRDVDVLSYQGTEMPLILFDELTHFSKHIFTYMLSRNRSTCGVRPYIRATTNPDADSFVRELIDWWIDEDGYAIECRDGVIRWFIVVDDAFVWFDTFDEAMQALKDLGFDDDVKPKSFTFVSAKLSDNPLLVRADPQYKANLMALSEYDRRQLLDGNWNVQPKGDFFREDWFRYYDILPETLNIYGASDYALSEEGGDYTVHGIFGVDSHDNTYLLDWWRSQSLSADWIDELVRLIKIWKPICWFEEGGSIIKGLKPFIDRELIANNTYCRREAFNYGNNNKKARATGISGRFQMGKIFFPKGRQWVATLKRELLAFPNGKHDDQVDVLSLFGMGLNSVHSALDKKQKVNQNELDYRKKKTKQQGGSLIL
jgi:predicted phage terminase large subunit-like protein